VAEGIVGTIGCRRVLEAREAFAEVYVSTIHSTAFVVLLVSACAAPRAGRAPEKAGDVLDSIVLYVDFKPGLSVQHRAQIEGNLAALGFIEISKPPRPSRPTAEHCQGTVHDPSAKLYAPRKGTGTRAMLLTSKAYLRQLDGIQHVAEVLTRDLPASGIGAWPLLDESITITIRPGHNQDQVIGLLLRQQLEAVSTAGWSYTVRAPSRTAVELFEQGEQMRGDPLVQEVATNVRAGVCTF
jgi:hypothetical protein